MDEIHEYNKEETGHFFLFASPVQDTNVYTL